MPCSEINKVTACQRGPELFRAYRLISGGGDRQVFVWDVATGRTIRKFRGHDGIVNAVRLSCLLISPSCYLLLHAC